MFQRVLRFVRLPLLLIVIWTVLRFLNGPVFGTPYAPRGNAMFSVLGLTIICGLIYGALSSRMGNFSWVGTILIGVVLGLFSQILIFLATLISYVAGIDTYFRHWDALNIPEGTTATLAQALMTRAGGFIAGPILGTITALIGRAVFGKLAPRYDEAGADRRF
jgi:uncharacterized membrane protein YeaQ/YmgE (transglycosylase-associated protein family)